MSERGIKNWQMLKNALIKEFKAEVNSAQLHKLLSERKIKNNESVQEYLLKMKEIASRGSVEQPQTGQNSSSSSFNARTKILFYLIGDTSSF